MPSSVPRLAFIAGLLLLFALACPASPYAATLTVTDLGDSGAPNQLRTQINAAAAGDTIQIITPGTILLTGAPGDDANVSGDLDISKSLTILGTGAATTIIDGGGTDRVFHITSSSAVVTISGMTIQNGAPPVSGGGAILNVGTLNLANAVVSGSSVSGVSALGGGIFNGATGVLTLSNVVVGCQSPGCKTGNTADAGGGIYNAFGGVVTLIDVTLGGNNTTAHSEGGGLFNAGTATLSNVTVSDNKSGVAGGGIFTTGTATLTNVTVSGNVADAGGGGIFACGGNAIDCPATAASGSTTLTNVTITGNAGGRGAGGGLLNTGALAPILVNVILSANTSDVPGAANCSGTISSLGHNLDDGTSCGFGLGDLSSTDPTLGPLQDNAGPTLTRALLAGSPAIDAGTTAVADCPLGCPTTDQRGVIRPQGAAWDIGAFEATSGGGTPPPAPVITSGPASPTNQTSATFDFSDADATATFLCALDSSAPGAFAACASGQSYGPGLVAGSHTFNVEARNLVGDSGITSFTWTIDLSAPSLTFTGVPSDPSNSTSASFSFFATEPSAFSCQLDAAAAEGCAPDPGAPADASKGTKSYTGLALGSHTFTVGATDLAGNVASPLIFTWTIAIDVTPPVLNITSHPFDPTNSNKADFAFETNEASTFTCQLAGPVSQGPAACTSATATTGTQSYAGLGEGAYTFTVRAMDAAGNPSSATFSWVVDQTPPTIAFGAPTPAPNANGWNNTSVSIPFTASDPSGIAAVTPSPLVLSAEGATITGSVTATDNAGNSTTVTSPAVKIDKTLPSIAFGAPTPAPNANGWNNTDVSIPFTPSDTLSGIDTALTTASPLALSAEGPAVTGSATATDNAGNSATVTSPAVKIDKTPPTVTLTTPTDGAAYTLGDTVNASYSCADTLSGIASCAGPVPSGSAIDTASAGPKTFTVTATDKAGNPATQTVNYSVTTSPTGSQLTALGPARVWIGLKNSDDVGLRVDLLAEVFLNGALVGQGQLEHKSTGSSGFNNAILYSIPLSLTGGPVYVPVGARLDFKLSARRTCLGNGHRSGTVRLWYNGQPVDSGSRRDAGSRFGATIDLSSITEFLRGGAALSSTAGSSRLFVDQFVNSSASCPFTPFGTWSLTLP